MIKTLTNALNIKKNAKRFPNADVLSNFPPSIVEAWNVGEQWDERESPF